jgi:hypothetical protein
LTWSTYRYNNNQYYAYAPIPYDCIEHAIESSPYDPCVFNGTPGEFGVDVVTVGGLSYIVVSRGENVYNSVDMELAKTMYFEVALKNATMLDVSTEEDGILSVVPNKKIYVYADNGTTKLKANFAIRYVLSE